MVFTLPKQKAPIQLEKHSFRDLSPETWNDFERFFAKYNGVQAGCWCIFYHRTGTTPGKTWAEKRENNHRDKKEMVMSGQSRSVLMYSGDEVIGSCQYGTKEELPRPEAGRIYKKLPPVSDKTALWRITCFFVDKEYRRRGAAKALLSEALKRIKESGGGLVEAYPVTHSRAVPVWFGTLSMYERLGFKVVSELGRSNVLVRKNI